MKMPNAADDNASQEEDGVHDDDAFNFFGIGLVSWCRITGLLHLFMCVVVGMSILVQEMQQIHPGRLVTPVTRTVGLWVHDAVDMPVVQLNNSMRLTEGCSVASSWRTARASYSVMPLVLSFGTLDTRIMMVCLYGLSALFQLWGSVSASVRA